MGEVIRSDGPAVLQVRTVAVRVFAAALFAMTFPLWGVALSERVVDFAPSMVLILLVLVLHGAVLAAPWERLLRRPAGVWMLRGYLVGINALLLTAYLLFDELPWTVLMVSVLSLILTGIAMSSRDHIIATVAVLGILVAGDPTLDAFSLSVVLVVVVLAAAALGLQGRSLLRACRTIDREREQAADEAARLQAIEDRREQTLSMIVHEIKNRLNIIMGSAETVSERHRDLAPKELEALTAATAAHARASGRIIEGLQLLATAGRLDRDHFEAVSILEAAQRVIEAVISEVDSHQVRHDVPAALRVTTDRALFMRALENLVTNAIAHTPPGTQVTISATPGTNGSVRVSVVDDGPGIPPEARTRLTEPFYRVGDWGDASGEGLGLNLGLGLTIVSRFLRAQGSELEIDTPPSGSGTAFSFELPRPSEAAS
ncbi:MAG: HAMP domain-containing sensor histidine kinase [Nitriliruptorales bacterium]|nr:HAMP domain-containing sensor histidine kinase [Nitriliruptorales bacterium]